MQPTDLLVEAHREVVSESVIATPTPAEVQAFAAPQIDAAPPPAIIATPRGEALPPILVADDDQDDRFFIERFIRKTGTKHPVKTFDDGSEVVNFLGSVRRETKAVRHRPPLLLFLDLNMRGLGGFGFLEWARRREELAPITIVVLSNSNNPDDVNRAYELGAHRYLVKYPSVPTFTSIVHGVYPFVLT